MEKDFLIILVSFIMGIIARTFMIKVDYRQYPTYPQSYLSHITLGIIAAGLGAVVIPAIANKEFVAVTFLAIAAQHFRDVRSLERESLDNIEPTELVPRGTAYIEDIAKIFEARNYMAILTATGTGATLYLALYFELNRYFSIALGIIIGSIIITALNRLLKMSTIEEIADVQSAEIEFDGPLLKIAGTFVMNIGLKDSREIFKKQGVAVEIIPKDKYATAILSNIGQRQAIQHNAAIQLGIRKDVDEPDFTPIARINTANGNVVMAIVVRDADINKYIEAVKGTPILESAKRKPIDI
ncbi:YIEGIA family protein [Serpentinicella sp. ANB-PHB4]|uniref:YIEGIA family protein n=1 Tax=Serpentinicella sp. ANB-PHB4 TaxID=3074076 RepID=UPI00285A0233|nr:YIEGIA family protein [Serpentinicella sp. ANB-PHB4]MDR5657909.1 YIEGIA family protein [Serpentinicella sp. ANB-PHB4]